MYNDSNIQEHLERSKLKLLKHGWQWQYEIDDSQCIINVFQNIKTKELRSSIYVYEAFRNQKIWQKFNEYEQRKYITMSDCGLENFFIRKGVDYIVLSDCLAYKAIEEYYGSAKAKRSNIPYINHIDEGCGILYLLNASQFAKEAFMIHPIYQNGEELPITYFECINLELKLLAKSYSGAANEFLRHNYKNVHPMVLEECLECESIKQMLIADKIQNYKDFMYNIKAYSERKDIKQYFLWWFDTLGVSHSFLNEAIDYISIGHYSVKDII